MIYNDYEINNSNRSRELYASQAMPVMMRKVYAWMTMALAISGITAFGVANNPGWLQMVQGSFLMLVIAELILVFAISGAINRLSVTTATLLFVLYSLINGAVLSTIFAVYTTSSITSVFFITAGTFASMSLYGFVTKKDLSSIGKLALMALIGIIIATLVNVFFMHSTMFDLVISILGVLVFVGLTAYDTQKIKEMLYYSGDTGETAHKIALLGALSLYLDFINIFLYLLRLFGDRK